MKRIDISKYVYIAVMISAIVVGSCSSKKKTRIIPAPKYTPSYSTIDTPALLDGLKYENYQSSIDTSFNYLDDVIEAFGKPNTKISNADK